VVRYMLGFGQGRDTVVKVKTFMVCCLVLLESVKDRFLRVDPRTTCVITCLVWKDMLNKLVYSGTCLIGGVDYKFKCGTP
jgi:hypothetical protein